MKRAACDLFNEFETEENLTATTVQIRQNLTIVGQTLCDDTIDVYLFLLHYVSQNEKTEIIHMRKKIITSSDR